MINKILKILKNNNNFLLSYSGGLDSSVLLHILIQIKIKNPNFYFRAIHINHQLHADSDLWSKHCQIECNKNNVSLIVQKINIQNNNVESRARSARYNIINKNKLPDEILLTAHHLNDQCETFLLALKRGSGPKGLSSMAIYKKNKSLIHIRPLLETKKSEIETWAKKNNIRWIEDTSNLNTYYDRNFLRNNIIPILQDKWPHFIKNCARSAYLCSIQEQVLQNFSNAILQDNLFLNNALNIEKLKYLSPEQNALILRHWIKLQGGEMPSYKKIKQINNDIIHSDIYKSPKMNFKTYAIYRYKNQIHFIKPIIPSVKHLIIFWHDITKPLLLPNKLGVISQHSMGIKIRVPKKNELINIRFQDNGYYYLIGKNNKKKLKKIWQEFNIPIWMRYNIPLLFYNNNLISALGLFITKKKDILSQNYWYISWYNKI
ncbi:MAG TPA: tRNA lysidine(34) synthetase TilS [Buchnera sp. (in: enterobacteria)]|nr:tRNA lysidine(34) synthetase TilS [Buchnera sp. (in: enterobacteria)]